MVGFLLGVPSKTSAAAVVAACERLPGPLAMRVETHRSARREVRWFFLFGCEERDVGETLGALLEMLPKLIVALSEDTSGVSSVRTFSRRGRRVATSGSRDGGEIATALAESFTAADAKGYVVGEWLDYGAHAPGWNHYGRLTGTTLARDEAVADELDVTAGALGWDALHDWEPDESASPLQSAPQRQGAQTPRTGQLDALRASLRPEPLVLGHHDSSRDEWSTSTPIRWWIVDGHGLVGQSQHEGGGRAPEAMVVTWATDPARSVAVPRHVAAVYTDPVLTYIKRTPQVLFADATHVYMLVGTTLQRFARAGTSPSEILASEPWLVSVSSATHDDEHIFLRSSGLCRVPKSGGPISRLSSDDAPSEGAQLVQDGLRYHDDGWSEDARQQTFRAVHGATTHTLAFGRRTHLQSLGGRLFALESRPASLAIHEVREGRSALLGEIPHDAVTIDLSILAIEDDRALGTVFRRSALLSCRIVPPTAGP